jgi:pseudaminic acid cytidylyltransferase
MANLCIIPARGGSKRIPKKNIKFFLGKPIIAYSIEVALNSGLFDEVMVSTDDSEIAEIAISCGAKVPFMRSEKNSSDFATTYDVLEEVLYKYKKNNKEFEYTCCLYPCAPLISIEQLNMAYILLKSNLFDSVIPVIPFSFPIQRAFRICEDEKLHFFFPEFALANSQDLEKGYHDAGEFYWIDTAKMLQKKKIVSNNTGYLELNELECQDIDNEIDWELVELKYKLLENRKNSL